MYKCLKCGGNSRKERLEIEDMDGNQVNPSTGDIKCDDCGYIGSKNEFTVEEN
jgi:DNA-directed RNA polymerase subunit RPC12/RpoP